VATLALLQEGGFPLALQSQLFRNDKTLEAAALRDSAHIRQGTRGDYVQKIQLALIQLDQAPIQPDGVYGGKTAAAVLAYKKKRNIINRSYQTIPDNIVGKMTIAALDAEMLQAENENLERPRIINVHPAETYRHRTRSPEYSLLQTQSKRGAKTTVEPAKIIVPGLFSMELKVGATGTFQVVDGIGGTVRCWDESIGFVFLPNEPLAHGGTMRVFQDPQTFGVFARAPGQTHIEASKPSQTFPLGDVISLIVVAADDVKQTWKPQWTVERKFRMNCNPFASHVFGDQVPGMGIQSQLVEFKGKVDPDSSVQIDDFELGILQTVLQARMVAVYVNSAGTPTWTLTISCPTPVRDAADNSPLWYFKTPAVKDLNAADGKQVESNDRPINVVPWQTKDKKGTLVSTSGLDSYCTWLAARKKSTGEFVFLSWASWSVGWGCTFDFKTEGRNLTGTTEITGQGDGRGPNTPITTGKRAIEQTTMTWTGPGGGF
jgi:hypothetical protein